MQPVDPKRPRAYAPARENGQRDMKTGAQHLKVRLAATPADLHAAQRLRYRVFARELGATGPTVDHAAGIEADAFDAYYDHLLLIDQSREGEDGGEAVVGAYRLLRSDVADGSGGFYCATEYDLGPLLASGRRLIELDRSCVDADYRGGAGMYHLWNALAAYVLDHGVEIMFGVASFHGTDPDRIAHSLAYLHANHLAPADMRVRVRDAHFTALDRVPPDRIDRKAAMVETPALIKAYLRLGGFIGDGAFIDHDFNTTDVCLIMDTGRMSERHRSWYTGRKGRGG